jgi:hypothetical protein
MRGESHRYPGRGPAGYGYPEQDEEYAGRWAEGPYRDIYRRDDRHRGYDDRYRGGEGDYCAGQPADRGYWGDEDAEYHRPDPATGGAEGNERLTGLIGMVLLVLFAVEGFTILAIHQLLTLHFFLGMLLVGPVLLKMCSTGYRFIRYYAGDAGYRRKGPPALPLRVLGPFVMLTSLAVIGTGIMLALVGPGPSIWLVAHKVSFVLWFAVMTIHVLAYIWRLPGLVSGDLATRAGHRAQEVLGGRAARWLLLTASLLTGLLLAVITVHLAGHWAAVPSHGR